MIPPTAAEEADLLAAIPSSNPLHMILRRLLFQRDVLHDNCIAWHNQTVLSMQEQLEDAVAVEREECAKLCTDPVIAAAIRARST